jgi:hypothetical protein
MPEQSLQYPYQTTGPLAFIICLVLIGELT